ncbi:MAG: DMP19 family protein [Chitinophagaceae bacterium]|nr:DMP19 family protein [Chitinophagaceae bacterium]
MSFFKKLFGDKDNSQGDNQKLNLDTLLTSADTNSTIIELDNHICKLCSWGDNLDRLTEPQKHFFFNQNLEREINNGGFNQYFYNSSGDYAHETLTSLQSIGANKTAVILRQAIDQFPNSTVPKDRQERQNVLEQIEDKANEVWENLDQKFYAYEDDLTELNLEYVEQHRNSFE